MEEPNDPNQPGKVVLWTGRVLSTLCVLSLLMGATMSLLKNQQATDGLKEFGWPEHMAIKLGVIELACAILYAIPATSVLGAILITGWLGGAVATHLRIGDPKAAFAVVFGIVVWLALFLREPRLRRLVPLRS